MNSLKNYSDMFELKTILMSVSKILLVTPSHWVYPQKKYGQYSGIKSQNPCENEYKKYCLNGGERYYLNDEDVLGCNCTWFYGGKRCEKFMCWT